MNFENIAGKGENVENRIFSFSNHLFLPYQKKTAPFEPHRNCHLQIFEFGYG